MAGRGKTGGSAGMRAGGRGPAREVGKGELELGRQDASAGGGPAVGRGSQPSTRRTAAKAPPAPRLPGEKAVRKTDATVPVGPRKVSPEERTPVPLPAVDHRQQIIGTDEP